MDIKKEDTYIQSILPTEYNALTLFVYFENRRKTFVTSFGTPLGIIRYFWREHTKYAVDMDYPDVASYLISRINQMRYAAPLEYLENTVQTNAQISMVEINNLAFLFMTNHCAISTDEIFGYVQMPQQRYMLIELLRDLKYPEEQLYGIADDIITRSVCVDYMFKRYSQ